MSGDNQDVRHLGTAEAYALARVGPVAGVQVTCSALFEDYRAWCGAQGFVALRESEFVAAFEAVAREVSIPLRQRGGNLSFLDVALRDHEYHAEMVGGAGRSGGQP